MSAPRALLWLAPLLLSLPSCSAHWGAGIPDRTPSGALVGPRGDAASCARWSSGKDGPYRLPLAGAVEEPELVTQLVAVPPEARRVALAAGLEPSLAKLLRDRPSLTSTELLARRQLLELQLLSLRTQVDATVYEADCSGDLLEQLRASLERDEASQNIRWTVLSIVTQAAAAVAIGTLELNDADPKATAIVGITGGVAASGLGVAAFVPPHRAIVLHHSRNLLRPLVRGSDSSHLYPSFVFRLLLSPGPSGVAPAQQLRARFDQLIDDAVEVHERSRARELLFGDGGIYDARLVEVRERMLDELESALTALSRDLELFHRYLQRASAGEPDQIVPDPRR